MILTLPLSLPLGPTLSLTLSLTNPDHLHSAALRSWLRVRSTPSPSSPAS